MSGGISLGIEITVVIAIGVFQIYVFRLTYRKIQQLKQFFPASVGKLEIVGRKLGISVLKDSYRFSKFLKRIPQQTIEGEEEVEVEMIDLPDELVEKYSRFNEVIVSTNSYLCKNKGTATDFNVLKDICERQVDALDDEIHHTLNVPLYLGLAGTFIGIICGLWGIDFNQFVAADQDITSLQHLITGVIFALSASFCGLAFTVINSAWLYNIAQTEMNKGKDDYYDFLQRELLPILAVGVSGSLNSLKSVLGHFVDKFGRNLDAYADSAELLNENLEKQHLVLEELNKLSLTRTANKIAETFITLKEASDELSVFREYQKGLNQTINQTGDVVKQFETLINKFNDFNDHLVTVADNSLITLELQRQFKESLETHFPTRSDYREVWRKEIDELNEDARNASAELNKQLADSTAYIQTFVSSNREFFSTFSQLQIVMGQLVDYAKVQGECYSDLKGEINGLRQDFKQVQIDTLQMNKDLLEAIRILTVVSKGKNNHDGEKR